MKAIQFEAVKRKVVGRSSVSGNVSEWGDAVVKVKATSRLNPIAAVVIDMQKVLRK